MGLPYMAMSRFGNATGNGEHHNFNKLKGFLGVLAAWLAMSWARKATSHAPPGCCNTPRDITPLHTAPYNSIAQHSMQQQTPRSAALTLLTVLSTAAHYFASMPHHVLYVHL